MPRGLITERLSEHSTLLVSALGVVFVVVRLWSVAGFDDVTALAVLSAQGTGSVVLGTLLTGVMFIPVAAAVACMTHAISVAAHGGRRAAMRWVYASLCLAIAGAAMTPWPLAAVTMNYPGLFILGRLYYRARSAVAKRRRPKGPREAEQARLHRLERQLRPAKLMMVSGVVVIGITLTFNPKPWLPSEELTAPGESVVGYVLSQDEHTLVVLTYKDRQILRLPTSQNWQRHLCSIAPADWGLSGPTPLGLLARDRPPQPCPQETTR